MAILDKLKEIVKIEIDLSHFININIANKPEEKEKLLPSKDGKTIHINYPALTPEENNKIKVLIKKDFEKGNIEIIEGNSNTRLKDIKQKLNSKLTKEILEFYKGKISEKHLKALEASLYLRQVFESGGSVIELKREIVHKFGDDGRNIANLCSGGYFEGYIKKMYEEMSLLSEFSIEKFKEYFEKIINISPFAIFVGKEMSEEEISGEIYHKLDTYKKYGIKFLDIQGIGKENVKKIKSIIQKLEQERQIDISISQERNLIQVRIFFNQDQ